MPPRDEPEAISPEKTRQQPGVFYTVTDMHTEYCNSRSQRYGTHAEAEREARNRLLTRPELRGTYIMRAETLVRRAAPPVEIIHL